MGYFTQWGREREDWECDKDAYALAAPESKQQSIRRCLARLSDTEYQTIVDVAGHPSKAALVSVNHTRGDFTVVENGKTVVYSF